MDRGYTDYQQLIQQLALRYGAVGRIIYCHDVPLPLLYHHALGVVTVNSTVGISALLHDLPVKVTGRAFYDIRHLTSQCSLDQFWKAPEPVHSELFNRLHSLIFRESQINGSFFNELPLTCQNTRLFYEQKFASVSAAEIVNVAELVQVVANEELDDYRASVRWDWNKAWLEDSDTWRLTGYSDLAINFWISRLGPEDQPSPDGAANVYAISFSPVFRLEHNTSDSMRLFVDAGVGLSYQSKKDIEKKLKSPINMGGHTQFEIRTMIGSRFGGQVQYEVSAGWFHYSNANLHDQNEALDFGVIQFGY
nr:acyloxyacyl hydrolase [Thalassotalea sp. G20_0]